MIENVAFSPPASGDLFDIIIVGGGLSGLPLAIGLTRAGLSVAVIEKRKPENLLADGFDSRTTAVALGAKHVLNGIGVWDRLAPYAGPIFDIRVMDGGVAPFVHYDHRSVGTEPLGWIVENRHLRHVLEIAAAELPGLTRLAPVEIRDLKRTQEIAAATLSDGRCIGARLVVAADGKGSATRETAGLKTIGWPYDQTSVVCQIEHDRPHRGLAVENFFPDGPFAMLPLPGNRTSIVWSTRPDRAAALMDLAEEAFIAQLRPRVGDWLGEIALAGPRETYPVTLFVAPSLVADRLALVGDAAHIIHPIAGQGLNLGLRDVATLAELIVDACRLGLDPGSSSLLKRYDTARRIDIARLAATTDGLYRLFSTDFAPVKYARRAGLALFQQMAPIKETAMRHAMGIAGDMPRLVRGRRL